MLELTFGRLYEHIGSWQPPGNSSRLTCHRCFQTGIPAQPMFAGIPHEVLHSFMAEIEDHAARRYLELTDQDEAGRSEEELTLEQRGCRLQRRCRRSRAEHRTARRPGHPQRPGHNRT